MPYRTPDSSAFTSMRKLAVDNGSTNTLSTTKFRAPFFYGLYRPFYDTNIVGNGVDSNKFTTPAPPPSPPVVVPLITIDDAGATDFSKVDEFIKYQFTPTPPASTFQVTVINSVVPSDIGQVYITDGQSRGLLGDVVISISPEWPTSQFVSDINEPILSQTTPPGNYPDNAVVTFSGVPIIEDLVITFFSINVS